MRIFPGWYAPVMVMEHAQRVVKVVVEFKPQPEQELLVACVGPYWTSPGHPDLLYVATITDEPPQKYWRRDKTGASSPSS